MSVAGDLSSLLFASELFLSMQIGTFCLFFSLARCHGHGLSGVLGRTGLACGTDTNVRGPEGGVRQEE